jgi:putative ABC transport system substrate-binding protein
MKKRIISILLVGLLTVGLIACHNKSETEPENVNNEESSSEDFVYNIAACLSEDNDYNQNLLKGFEDSLADYIGEDHIKVTVYTTSEDMASDDVVKKALAANPDMIFTAGKATLTSATTATETVPIIATGIVDFKGTLRITSLDGKSWDKTTGRNVTGVSSKPSIVDQVSLMIESTEDLQTVGILFSPEDTDAIYQNEIFESYLDQAGIPWKEYLVPASENALGEREDQNSTALTPSKYTAYSAKTGIDDTVEALGEDSILGLNSPSSTRVAEVSAFWTGGKKTGGRTLAEEAEIATDEESEDSEEASTESSSSKANDSDEKDSEEEITLESRIQEACDECSAIYIPFGSILTDQMETIGSIATESNVSIVAGDTKIAENALVTLFTDPYSLGYSAGKKAVKVFNGDEISEIKISYGDSDDDVKLYNGQIAEQFGLEFPKSFSELNDFLSTYEYGSNTTRHQASDEEE